MTKGYTYTKSGGTFYAKFAQHTHSIAYSISGDTITKSCTAEGCPGGVGGTATLTANGATYDGKSHAASVSKTGDVTAELTYSSGSAPTAVGTYEVTMKVDGGTAANTTLTKSFTIEQASITAVTLNSTSFNYDGTDKTTSIKSVKAGSLTLNADDYDVSGDAMTQVGSLTEKKTYTVTVTGKGNYTGSASAPWTINNPSGSFKDDALKPGAGCAANGNTATVNDSAKLVYANGKWYASMTIELPNDQSKDGSYVKGATFVNAANTRVEYKGNTYAGSQIQGGAVPELTAPEETSVDYKYGLIYEQRTYKYLPSVTYTMELTPEIITAALTEGKDALEGSVTIYALAWKDNQDYGTFGCETGLKPTTYTLTVSIDKNNPKLFDENNQVYPELPYIANIGAKKFLTLADALGSELATAGQTVEVYGDAAAESGLVLPVGVTLNLGAHGNAESSYVLTGAQLNNDAKVVSTKKLELAKFSARGDGVADNFFKIVETEASGTYTYELALNHEHLWGDFELNGNVLTAKCTNELNTCTYGDGTVSITLNAEGKVWTADDSGVTPTLSGKEAFEALLTDGGQHAVTVGEVTVDHPAYSKDKWRAGAYTAKCTVTIDGVDHELKQTFEITKPEKYTNGFEAQIEGYGVRFDTFGEAANAVPENSVITLRYDGWNAASFTATAGQNITLDLNGKTLTYSKSQAAASDFTIQNDGAGTVTLVNGTISQPKGQNYNWGWKDTYYQIITSGNFAFGQNLVVLKGDDTTVTAMNGKLSVVDGVYQTAFAQGEGGTVEITGGIFLYDDHCKPTLIPAGYVRITTPVDGGNVYQVIQHVHTYVTDIIGENTISNYCAAGGCDDATGKWATIAVTTPLTYTGKAFAGVTKTGDLAATLEYFSGEESLGATAPTAAGENYKVVMSYNGKSIEKPFVIEPATIDSVTFNPATPDFTGSPITTKMTVKAGSLTLDANDYDITAGSLTETGSASATTNIEVTVVGKGNFQGTKTGSWTIKAPGTGDATFETPTLGGDYGTLNGTTLTIDEKSTNLTETAAGSCVWTMSMTVGVPLSQNNRTYVFTPEELLFFTKNGSEPVDGTKTEALAECGIVVSHNNTAISQGTYKNKYKAESFTWTEKITAEEAVAAAEEGKIVRTIKAYAVSYNELYNYYTLTNEGGLPETTYTMEIPLETLKLIDQYGNQRYPVLTYVAKIGNVEYTSVSNALEAAKENETVELTAADTVGGAYELPIGVTLKLGSYGNAAATYKLYASSKLISAAAIDKDRLSADTGLGVKDAQPVEGGFLYETEIVHVHEWTFAANGNVLTATCGNTKDDCYLKEEHNCQLKIMLNAAGGEWTGEAFAATVEDGFVVGEAPEVEGYSVGEITYSACDRDGQWGAYTTDKPVQVGKYKAQVTVTVIGAEGSPFTLVKEYEITKPATYSSGFELKETGGHYTSFPDAVADARDGDTIVWWEGNKNKANFDFTSDKNIIVDLNGATLTYRTESGMSNPAEDIKLINNGVGVVTFVKCTINQPYGYVMWVKSATQIQVQGKFVFGEGVICKNEADRSQNYLTITADDGALIVSNGVYEAGFAKANNGSVSIVGGKFWSNDNPSGKGFVLDEGDKYVVRSINETVDGVSCKYAVVPHTHVWKAAASGNVLTVTCDGADSDLCDYGPGKPVVFTATLKLPENKVADGQPAVAEVEYTDAFPAEMKAAVVDYFDVVGGEQVPREGAPTEKGVYAAAVTIGGQTVSGQFTIWHDGEHAYHYELDAAAGKVTAKCTLEPCAEGNKEYVLALTVSDKTYDGTPCEATAEGATFFPGEVSALAYYRDEARLDGAPTDAGTYAVVMVVTPNGGDAGSAMTVRKTFEIARAEATVTPDAASKFVGTADPKFTATVTGLGEGDELVYTVSRTNAAETVGAYDLIASGESVQGNYAVTYVDAVKAFEIKAGRVILNGIGTDDVAAAFASLGTDGGSLVFNEAVTEGACTFAAATSLTVADGAWFVTNDLTLAETTVTNDIFVANKLTLEGNVTVGSDEAKATLAFKSIELGDYRLALTTNGVVRSAAQLDVETAFAAAPEHFEVSGKPIEGGFEYALAEVKRTFTITIAKDTCVADVQTNGVTVVGALELPADATTVELTLVAADGLTIPVYKVITNDVTNVTQRVATYAVVEGLTYTFIAEEAKVDDPIVSEEDVKKAIIAAVDPGPSHDAAVANIETVTGGDEPKVAPKELATWITDKGIKSVDIAASDYLVASVKLDTPKPITDETEVKVGTFESASAEGFELSITIKIEQDATPEVVKAAKENVVGYIQAVDALGNEFGPVDASRVEIDPATGKVTITPVDGKASEFFRVVIPNDK